MLFHVGAILRLNEFGMLAGKKEAESDIPQLMRDSLTRDHRKSRESQ